MAAAFFKDGRFPLSAKPALSYCSDGDIQFKQKGVFYQNSAGG
jgi:hypothetical protein